MGGRKFPAALVHESIHRGLGILKANRLLFYVDADGKRKDIDLNEVFTNEYGVRFNKDELLTRAFMMKLFDDIELSQEGKSEDRLTEADRSEDTGAAAMLAARKYIKAAELDQIEEAARKLLHEFQRPPGTVDGMPLRHGGPR